MNTRHVWLATALAAAALAYPVRTLRLSAFEAALAAQKPEDLSFLPASNWMPVLSLGFNSALADLLWCKSLVYFGEGVTRGSELRSVFAYTDAEIALDPSFRAAYRWIATAAVYRGRDHIAADGLEAAAYLERAVARWPNDGELRWDLGSLLRFDIAPLIDNKAQKDAILLRAEPHITAAARLGAGPAWLVLNSASLLERVGRTEQAVRHLEEAYAIVDDEDTRTQIAFRLARLRGQAFEEVASAYERSFDEDRRAHFNYLSVDQYLLLQPSSTRSYAEDVLGHFVQPPEPEPVPDDEAPDTYSPDAGSPSP